jgi:signal transduction histidine kinase
MRPAPQAVLLGVAMVAWIMAGHWLAGWSDAGLSAERLALALLLVVAGILLVALVLNQRVAGVTGLAGPRTTTRERSRDSLSASTLSPALGATPALRVPIAQMLELQSQLLLGLPGPALLLKPTPDHQGWQLLASNDAARATLPPRGSPALERVITDLVEQAGSTTLHPPLARACRLALPDGCQIIWLPPAAEPATAASAPTNAGDSTADDDRAAIVYTVSHDLRAPIRVIEGFTRIVREDYGHLLDRVGNDHLDRVLGAATRMNSMIDALLALSRLSTQPLERVAVDLSELARQVITELHVQAPERQVDVLIADGLTARGDPTLLRMVLDNLLGNAWKYSSKRTHARIEFGRLDSADGSPTTFYVRDNGAGFDMRFAGKLFGAFQRLHGATEFAGTGIGLASVRRIVRRHGGDIRAEAAVDQGATFYFTLA